MRHQPQDVASRVDHARDVASRPVRVGRRSDVAVRIAVAQHDLDIEIDRGYVIALAVCDRQPQ